MNNPDGFRVLCGPANPALAAAAPPLPPFAPQAVEFLAALSAALLKDPSARAYPEVVSFAFFCRRANLQAMRASSTIFPCGWAAGLRSISRRAMCP